MIYGERPGRRELEADGRGVTGSITYLCDWADVDPAPIDLLPQVGESWVDAAGMPQDWLKCVRVVAREGTTTECEYTAYYSTEGRRENQETQPFCEWSLDLSMEPGPDITGYTWEEGGVPVVDMQARQIPVGILTGRMHKLLPPYQTVMETVGKVNSVEFQGYAPGTLMFLGANAECSTDMQGNIVSAGVIYKFSVKLREHKYFWRPPMQARDRFGNFLFWHDDPREPKYCLPTPGADNAGWSTSLPTGMSYEDWVTDINAVIVRDDPEVWTPVWANQVPGNLDVTSGAGGWDTILDENGEPYYPECDFATELDIPDQT